MLRTINSLGISTVTRPTVGRSVFGRITAEPTCRANAFELAVEKVAEPKVSVAAGLASSCEKVAMLVLERSSRAGPGRTWTLPDWSGLGLSPAKRVAPTGA